MRPPGVIMVAGDAAPAPILIWNLVSGLVLSKLTTKNSLLYTSVVVPLILILLSVLRPCLWNVLMVAIPLTES